MLFGKTTRTSQVVCFKFKNTVQVFACDQVTCGTGKSRVLVAPVVYERDTQELRYWDYTEDSEVHPMMFDIMCRSEGPTDEIAVSLAASITMNTDVYDMVVMKINWIDAAPMRNEQLRYSNGSLTFPYDKQYSYKVWHIVMSNGCRIEVRVISFRSTNRSVRWSLRNLVDQKWTLVNTDDHPGFAESAFILHQYYSFQGDLGRIIYPIERNTVAGFVSLNRLRFKNLSLLTDARIEHPPAVETHIIEERCDSRTTQLIHAMVLKSLVVVESLTIEYPRLEHVCSVSDSSLADFGFNAG